MVKFLKPYPLRILFLLLLIPSAAHAYIDMGTGAFLVQALMAIAGAVVLFIRHPIKTLKAWWKRRRTGSDE
jgi:amino acid transporter